MDESPPRPAPRDTKELLLLFDISQRIAVSEDVRDVAEPILRSMAEHMGMLRGTLTLQDKRTGELFIEAAWGLSAAQQSRGRYRVGEGVTGRVVAENRPAVVPRIAEAPYFLDRTKARRHVDKRDVSFVCVPITSGGEVFGALSADRLFRDDIALDEDLRLLTIIASLIAQAVKARQSTLLEQHSLREENARLHNALQDRFRPQNLVGSSRAMQSVYDLIGQVASSDATVLILGESGVGKELVASAIHYEGPRKSKPFIKVNCAALPETLLESELFGHEQGAFTGATKERKGRFELAHGGTLFLDEVGDLSPIAQVKLLRALQEKEFERVGGTKTLRSDVRIIAATHRDLAQRVSSGSFREDLYWRLNVFPIVVPALRDRKADILQLADHFVDKYGRAGKRKVRRISTPAIDLLTAYHWPGNVRELENAVERAVLLADEDVIRSHHLPPTLQMSEPTAIGHRSLDTRLAEVERELLIEAIKSSNGNCAKAARSLGLTERKMGLRIAKHGLDPTNYKRTERRPVEA
ncbi:MAG: sigma-54-dependent Fis family transcriptional regulator [Myxococcota bacterium]